MLLDRVSGGQTTVWRHVKGLNGALAIVHRHWAVAPIQAGRAGLATPDPLSYVPDPSDKIDSR